MTPDPAAERLGQRIATIAQRLHLGRPAARLAWWAVTRWATPEQRARIEPDARQAGLTHDETPRTPPAGGDAA